MGRSKILDPATYDFTMEIIGRSPKLYTVKISEDFLSNYVDSPNVCDILEEKLVDSLSVLEEELDSLVVPEDYIYIVEKARKREYADVFMYPFNACILSDSDIRFSDFGLTDKEYVCVQCWVVNSKVNNWNRHQYKGKCMINEYILTLFFKGKKEGDFTIVNSKGIEFKLVLRQTKYRYNYGKFHKLFEGYTKKFDI